MVNAAESKSLLVAADAWIDGTCESIMADCQAAESNAPATNKPRAGTLISEVDAWYDAEVKDLQIRAAESKRQVDRLVTKNEDFGLQCRPRPE